jgi:fructosamine-3-kinase
VVFAKTCRGAPAGMFEAEARGLDRLRTADGPPVPEVVAVTPDGLVLEWVEPGGPSAQVAREFGRALARMHRSPWVGGPKYGADAPGVIATLPLDNRPAADWPTFYAERRLAPYLSALDAAQRRVVEEACVRIAEIAGPPEPAARIHGDLWSGNLLWGADGQVWLVDAASAHGGHRETDLALLALFGAPYLDEIVRGYEEVAPLADGWRTRLPLHQLHPLLVHATLFGGGYAARAADAARAALRTP